MRSFNTVTVINVCACTIGCVILLKRQLPRDNVSEYLVVLFLLYYIVTMSTNHTLKNAEQQQQQLYLFLCCVL